jgi:hypothetical protein
VSGLVTGCQHLLADLNGAEGPSNWAVLTASPDGAVNAAMRGLLSAATEGAQACLGGNYDVAAADFTDAMTQMQLAIAQIQLHYAGPIFG